MDSNRIIIIGAGASGMLAAGRAAEAGAKVLLLEKKDSPGNKILISGKTRCNITNSKGIDEFIPMYGVNGKFLYNTFARYFRDDLLAMLKRYGVETKTERGGRIFPVSDNAGDVVSALIKYITDNKVIISCRSGNNSHRRGILPGNRLHWRRLSHGSRSQPYHRAAAPSAGATGRGRGRAGKEHAGSNTAKRAPDCISMHSR